MPQLRFQIEGAQPMPSAVAPTIAFKLRITNSNQDEPIHTISLRCQLQIETPRRRYNQEEQETLFDLYGEPNRWGQTLKSMLWQQLSVNIGSFTNDTVIDLLVPCTFDFNVAATKYFAALQEGQVPLAFLFSGTIFFRAPEAPIQVAQIPWDTEANYRLPTSVWQTMMQVYYPHEKWLVIGEQVFERIAEYKRRHAMPTWDQALESLLSITDQVDERPLAASKAS